MYLQVGSGSLTARILGPATAVGSKQSIALGRIFRTRACSALCETIFRVRRHLACHFEVHFLLCTYEYGRKSASPAEDKKGHTMGR